MKFLSILFVLAISMYSCQNETKIKQLKEVDKMMFLIDSIKTTFYKNNNDSILQYVTMVMNVELRIKNNYVSDTINEDFVKKMNNYKQVRKKLLPIIKMKDKLKKGCQEELETLKNLQSDIEKGAGDKTKYDSYLIFERSKISDLEQILKEIINVQSKQVAMFNLYHKELHDFSMSLEPVIP